MLSFRLKLGDWIQIGEALIHFEKASSQNRIQVSIEAPMDYSITRGHLMPDWALQKISDLREERP